MSTAWVECWKCDACGHRWIKGELYPAQCGKCRSRKWNDSGKTDSQIATEVKEVLGAAVDEFHPSKPNMQALREICAGKVAGVGVHEREEHVPTTTVPAEITICGKDWWEDGTHYQCLMDKGHRDQKHGLRGMVQRLED